MKYGFLHRPQFSRCTAYSAERVLYSVHALPRVVTRDARDSALRPRECAQRGYAQRVQLTTNQLHTLRTTPLRTCPRS